MNVWLAVSLVLAVVALYMFVIEIFSVAFKLTGLASSKIRFQVANLFTGVGYTTNESELISKDDTRRKIAIACMYTGHIFSVVFMGLVINVVISLSILIHTPYDIPKFNEWYFIIFYITSALFLIMLFLKIPPVNRRFQRQLENIAINASKKNKHKNILNVLDLQGKHAIVEVILNHVPDFANEVPLFEMGLTWKYSITVLSIRRDNRVLEVNKDTMFKKGDVLITYGLINDIKEAFVLSISKNPEETYMDRTNEINLINNYGPNALVEVEIYEVPKLFQNAKVQDLKIKEMYDITLIFVKRKNEYISVNKNTIIGKGDNLTVFGPYKNIKLLFKNDEQDQINEPKSLKNKE